MPRDIQDEGSKALDQVEHNADASAKRVVVRAQDPSSGDFVNIGANDNGDGTFSLKTDATFSGSVNAVTEYSDGSSTVATPSAPGLTFDNAGTIAFVSDTNPLPVDATVNASVNLGDKDIGNASADTQRVVLASDQPVIPVSDNGGSITVDGTFWQTTQPVSAASLPLPTGAATAANQQTDALTDTELRASDVPVTLDGESVAVTGTFWQATQPVSAASLPLPTGAATAANQQTDALTDTELRASPVVVDLGANNDVTVSGTVTANLSATDNAVLDDIAANQTDNSQKTQIVDASGNAVTVTGNKLDVNASATLSGTTLPISSATDAVGVAIVDGSGDQITSFGGGTQYTEGDTDATFTGTMSLVEGSANAAATLKQPTTPSDTQPISASSLPLPTGAATATNQSTANTTLSSIDSALAGTLTVDASGTTVPVSDAGGSLTVDGTVAATQSGTWNVTNVSGTVSLPTGASTAANQTTLIGRLPATATAADNTANPSISKIGSYGFVYDGTTWDRQPGNSTDGTLVNLGANNDVTVSNTVTVDGSGVTQPISASSLPLPTGAATAANQQTDALTDTELRAAPVVVDLGANNDVTVTSGTVTANLGATDNAVLDSIDTAVNGTLTVDGSGVTQPISAASLPLPSGAATAANQSTANSSLSTIATNTSRGSSATLSNVSGSATSVTLLSANSSRLEATITNDSTADLYVKLGTTASTSSYTVKLGQDESYVTDKYTGRIDGIWSSATGNARVTEL